MSAQVIDLATIRTPADLENVAENFKTPLPIEQGVNVEIIEKLIRDAPEDSRVSEQGLFPGVDPEKWTAEQMEECEARIAQAKADTRESDEARKEEKAPSLQLGRGIDARWGVLQRFKVAMRDRLIGDWQKARRAIEKREAEARRLAEEKAEKERRRLAAEADAAEEKGRAARADNLRDRAASVQATVPAAFSESKPSAINMRDEWTYEILDASKLPPEFLIPDHTAIGKTVKAMKERAETMLNGAIKVNCEKVPVAKGRR